MSRAWMLDEISHAGQEHLDAAFVAGYDRKQGWPAFDDDIAVLLSHGLDTESTVVDLGAGTGRFALAAAHAFKSVIAIDASPTMLAHTRSRVAAEAITNVRCVQAGFLSYQHQGPPADAVYTRNALHQLPDFWKVMALRHIAAALRPGGVLRLRDLVYSFEPSDAADVFDRWLARAGGDPASGYTADDYAEHIRTEHSTFSWLLERMLDATGFEIVDADLSGPVFAAYTCIRRPSR